MRASTEPAAIVIDIGPRLAPVDARALSDLVRGLRAMGNVHLVVCDVSQIVDPDFVTVDALARLALGVRRCGCHVRLRGASPKLRELLALAGLGEVLPCGPDQSSR
jgi:ABC-type transporter Mla MlaB component